MAGGVEDENAGGQRSLGGRRANDQLARGASPHPRQGTRPSLHYHTPPSQPTVAPPTCVDRVADEPGIQPAAVGVGHLQAHGGQRPQGDGEWLLGHVGHDEARGLRACVCGWGWGRGGKLSRRGWIEQQGACAGALSKGQQQHAAELHAGSSRRSQAAAQRTREPVQQATPARPRLPTCSAYAMPNVAIATRPWCGGQSGSRSSAVPTPNSAANWARCAAACRRPSCLWPCSRFGIVVRSTCGGHEAGSGGSFSTSVRRNQGPGRNGVLPALPSFTLPSHRPRCPPRTCLLPASLNTRSTCCTLVSSAMHTMKSAAQWLS